LVLPWFRLGSARSMSAADLLEHTSLLQAEITFSALSLRSGVVMNLRR